tara:strand:- start:6696 stop:6830 length:135 start_codon:yes stop_codon:yes gene_type:complete
LSDRQISIVVLTSISWPRMQRVLDEITKAINQVAETKYQEIDIP